MSFCWVLLGFTGFYWVLLGFYWVLLGFTGFFLVSSSRKGFCTGVTGFLPDLIELFIVGYASFVLSNGFFTEIGIG